MSCGKPHETPCTEVLAELYWYLDQELDQPGRAKILSTSTSAAPACVSTAWRRSSSSWCIRCCRDDKAPTGLRVKVMARIQEIRHRA